MDEHAGTEGEARAKGVEGLVNELSRLAVDAETLSEEMRVIAWNAERQPAPAGKVEHEINERSKQLARLKARIRDGAGIPAVQEYVVEHPAILERLRQYL